MPFKPLTKISYADHKIDDLAGMNCLILGENDGLSNDLAVYLRSAGAVVEQAPHLNNVEQIVQKLAPGLWLVVIDAGEQVPSIEELRAAFNARSEIIKNAAETGLYQSHPFIEPRFIVIKRGRRRQARIEDIDIITLDGDVMYRQSLFRAMEIAAGRIEAETEETPSLKSVITSAPKPITREEALRQRILILVAEDNDINQKVIRQQLNLLGYAADIASDGKEALKRWQTGDYDLLLTDLHMPEMDGFELTREIRAIETNQKHIPIVALTANALKGEKERCLQTGMDDYLSKPVQLEDLRLMLERYLPNRKLIEATRSDSQPALPDSKTESTGTPLDIHVLEQLVGNDPEMIKEMLLDFYTSAEKIAAELHMAYQASQLTTVGSLAHKLKSSARSVGALALGEVCAQMEQAGKDNDAKALAEFFTTFDMLMISIKTYLNTLYAKDE